MTENTRRDGLIGIGELSRRTGVPVRTIRFYCDEGILEPRRSAGGHRIFDPETAVDRLRLIRRLRALGLGLSAVVAVLTDTISIAEAAAAERAALDTELGAMTWRRATLTAVEQAPPAERAARLELLAAVHDRHRAHYQLVAFWRRQLVGSPTALFDGFVAMNIPAPPADPTPRHVLAFAELTAIVTDPGSAVAMRRYLWRTDPGRIRDKREFLTELAGACEAAGVLLGAGVTPRPGAELDRFVAAHAAARREPDTPRFRERLLRVAAPDYRIHRYWASTAEIIGEVTTGAAEHWLHRALAQTARSRSGDE
ncbi:MerR family transcriptional regulator [Nocardia bovistercoris]|uniref:MerR family transcriptional regulator n=1 Tax=Nocardia bovistercoris TaxID=2785916 RepID=A0A931ICD1_9NOCA|nr:MerR family transcriptional regulator [Nocardia bovistercoris]